MDFSEYAVLTSVSAGLWVFCRLECFISEASIRPKGSCNGNECVLTLLPTTGARSVGCEKRDYVM